MPVGSGGRYRVINLGLSGESSDGYEAAIKVLLSKVTPEVVILYAGYTDIFAKAELLLAGREQVFAVRG